MSKARPSTSLYRLIEAGQRAHRAVLVPLIDRGLEPGDDAVLFILGDGEGVIESELALRTGTELDDLGPRIERLIERELVSRHAVGPELEPGYALTARGERVRAVLEGNWAELANALFGEFDGKTRKRLDKALKRMVQLLRL